MIGECISVIGGSGKEGRCYIGINDSLGGQFPCAVKLLQPVLIKVPCYYYGDGEPRDIDLPRIPSCGISLDHLASSLSHLSPQSQNIHHPAPICRQQTFLGIWEEVHIQQRLPDQKDLYSKSQKGSFRQIPKVVIWAVLQWSINGVRSLEGAASPLPFHPQESHSAAAGGSCLEIHLLPLCLQRTSCSTLRSQFWSQLKSVLLAFVWHFFLGASHIHFLNNLCQNPER